MKYKFPHLTNISQVLPLIANKPEFVVSEKEGGYSVVNYLVHMPDSFPPVASEGEAILRELRGIIFNTETGEILHRRLHKFFNVGEREETQPHLIDLNEPHVILEKLDGSMITPIIVKPTLDEHVRWGTKMGLTDVAKPVEEFVAAHSQYEQFALYCYFRGMTPIFEWCSRKQRIVIDYPEDQLVLTAMRNNHSGEYVKYDALCKFGETFKIPVVQAYKGTARGMEALLADIKGLQDAEGFVIRFDDGHMLKVKGDWYIRLHQAKEAIQFEKNVISMLVHNTIDDVKAALMPGDLERLLKFEKQFWDGVKNMADIFNAHRESAKLAGVDRDRKTYAVEFVQKICDPKHSRIFYKMFDADPSKTLEFLVELIAGSCQSQTTINEARWAWGGANWNYGEQE